MIRYQKLHGVNVGAASALPAVPISPEGQAMGSVPGWRIFLDPAHTVNGAPRNRALPNNVTSLSSESLAAGVFDNGSPAFQFNETMSIQPNVSINNETWTAFCVVKLAEGPGGTAADFVDSIDSWEEPALSVRYGFNVTKESMTYYTGYSVSAEGNRARYTLPEGSFVDRTVLAMWTFSTRDGIRLFIDGKLEDHAEDDKRPFDVGYLAGEWRMFNGFRGLVGMSGMLDIDLGWAEHTGHRRAIEKFLMNKYEIS